MFNKRAWRIVHAYKSKSKSSIEFERDDTEISSIISFSTTSHDAAKTERWLLEVNRRERVSASLLLHVTVKSSVSESLASKSS